MTSCAFIYEVSDCVVLALVGWGAINCNSNSPCGSVSRTTLHRPDDRTWAKRPEQPCTTTIDVEPRPWCNIFIPGESFNTGCEIRRHNTTTATDHLPNYHPTKSSRNASRCTWCSSLHYPSPVTLAGGPFALAIYTNH